MVLISPEAWLSFGTACGALLGAPASGRAAVQCLLLLARKGLWRARLRLFKVLSGRQSIAVSYLQICWALQLTKLSSADLHVNSIMLRHGTGPAVEQCNLNPKP